jgi:hypothetical protein
MRGSLVAALLLVTGPALAQAPLEPCEGAMAECTFGPQAVIVTGSPALEPLFKNMSAALKKANGTDVYYVRGIGQCQAAQQVMEGADLSGQVADFLGDIKVYSGRCCSVPFFQNVKADMWVADSAVEDCFDGKSPPEYRDFPGPIVAYSIVAPWNSSQWAITAEEAYFVFGFGSAGYKNQTVPPWADQSHFVVPGASFGAQALWAKFLRLPALPHLDRKPQVNPADPIKGRATDGAEKVIPTLIDPLLSGDGAIGLTSAQALDGAADRGHVKPLAVQAWKQRRAFYADSTSRSFDKRNVREGRYPFWAPTHMVARADVTGRVLNARVEAIINDVQGRTELEGLNIIDATVAARLVPGCAMKVQRAKEKPDTGDLMPYRPAPGTACGCYMDELLSRGSSGCAACNEASPCAGGKTCSHAFCE